MKPQPTTIATTQTTTDKVPSKARTTAVTPSQVLKRTSQRKPKKTTPKTSKNRPEREPRVLKDTLTSFQKRPATTTLPTEPGTTRTRWTGIPLRWETPEWKRNLPKKMKQV